MPVLLRSEAQAVVDVRDVLFVVATEGLEIVEGVVVVVVVVVEVVVVMLRHIGRPLVPSRPPMERAPRWTHLATGAGADIFVRVERAK